MRQGVLVAALVAAGCKPVSGPPPAAPLRPVPLGELYGAAPWISVIPQLSAPPGTDGVKASDCGKCHVAHYEDWRRSTHSNAYTDLQFRSELAKPSSPAWLCLNCHLPVENQREFTVRALVEGKLDQPLPIVNPRFDAAMQQEGVTCATCHVRTDESGQSYILAPTGAGQAPHPMRVDRAALHARCNDCHDQSYRLTPQLVCAFETGKELAASATPERSCPSCHMAEVERALTNLGTPVRRAHRHSFVGGPVPKRFDLYGPGLAAEFRPGLEVQWRATPQREGISVEVELRNQSAAHHVPTGDPERFYEIVLELVDAQDRVVARERLRLGQLWRWEPSAERLFDNRVAAGASRRWQPTLLPGVAGDEGYAAGEPARRTSALGGVHAAPVRVRLVVRHVRLTDDNAAWMQQHAADAPAALRDRIAHLDAHYPRSSVVYRGALDLSSTRRTTERSDVLLAQPEAGR